MKSENLSFLHANNKDTDQLTHMHNLALRLENIFMLTSTELEISTAHNNKNAVNYRLQLQESESESCQNRFYTIKVAINNDADHTVSIKN